MSEYEGAARPDGDRIRLPLVLPGVYLKPGNREPPLFHHRELKRPVKTGGTEQQKFPDVLRHLITERLGDVDDDMRIFARVLADLNIEFLKEIEYRPEIHSLYDPYVTDPLCIDHNPVRFRFPEKN
jgi:hypothetical protein